MLHSVKVDGEFSCYSMKMHHNSNDADLHWSSAFTVWKTAAWTSKHCKSSSSVLYGSKLVIDNVKQTVLHIELHTFRTQSFLCLSIVTGRLMLAVVRDVRDCSCSRFSLRHKLDLNRDGYVRTYLENLTAVSCVKPATFTLVLTRVT